MQGIKTILAARYTRMKNGLLAHDSEFSPTIRELLRIPELTALGDKFLADTAAEIAAEPELSPLRVARATAELELRAAYDRVRNFVEAWIGEKNTTELAQYVRTGSLLDRAIHLRNALATNPDFAAKVDSESVAALTREIGEYEVARDQLAATEKIEAESDSATDSAIRPLADALVRTRLYLVAWTVDIGRPELITEFVLPRVVKNSTPGVAQPQGSEATPPAA